MDSNPAPAPCTFHSWKQKPASTRGYKMMSKCNQCGKTISNVFPATTFEGFIRRWVHSKLTDKTKKGETITQREVGNYRASPDKLYYYGAGRNTSVGEDVLAIKLPDGRIIGNASKLNRCGSYRRGLESPAQRVMQNLEMPLIPFNIFDEAKLDIRTAEVIAQGTPEKLLSPKLIWSDYNHNLVPLDLWQWVYHKHEKPARSKFIRNVQSDRIDNNKTEWSYEQFQHKNLEKRHFIGAMVIKVADKFYLFDVDRREIQFHRFNAFLSELPRPCTSIEDAYDSLIPDAVRRARKQGKKVLRQGEWFFIPSSIPKSKKASETAKKIADKMPKPESFDLSGYRYRNAQPITDAELKEETADLTPKYVEQHKERVADYNQAVKVYQSALKEVARENPDKYAKRGELRANNNRPNHCSKFVSLPEGEFVSGEVTHSGREHEPIRLQGWYKAVPNTAIGSWTIVGAID